MMETVKLGIVGFGFMGHCDADMMSTFDDSEIKLVAVADTNPEQLKDAPEGVETYNSIEEKQILIQLWYLLQTQAIQKW